MSKFNTILVFLVLLSVQTNCYSLNNNLDEGLKIEADEERGFDQINKVRVIRQIGYSSPGVGRETVIVIPNSEPRTTNAAHETPIVIVKPNNYKYSTSGQRYLSKQK